MIYTRFGTPVQVVAGNLEKNEVDVRRPDGGLLHTYLYELRADGGAKEIERAINVATRQWQGGAE